MGAIGHRFRAKFGRKGGRIAGVEILLTRAALAPIVILAVSLVARRVGPRRGGRLMGLPLTTSPFLVLVCAQYGADAATRAATGTLSGQLTVACFCMAYASLATAGCCRALLLSTGLAATCGMVATAVGVPWLVAASAFTVVLAVRLANDEKAEPAPSRAERRWELPLRMGISGATVVAAMLVGQAFGAYVAGVVSSLPILLAVLLPSLHHASGADAAAELARGAMSSVAATTAFLFVLSVALAPLGPPLAFGLAAATLVAVEPMLRATVDRRPPPRWTYAGRL